MADQKDSNLVRLTGLWKGQSKEGETFLSGGISASSRLLVLPNKRKQKPSEPDYIAYIAPQEKKEGQTSRQQVSGL